MRAGFHEGGPNGGVENNADLFYSASELYNPKDIVVQVQAKFISKMPLHIKSLSMRFFY